MTHRLPGNEQDTCFDHSLNEASLFACDHIEVGCHSCDVHDAACATATN